MRILVADDHPIVLKGICVHLVSKNYQVVCSCSNGIEAWNSIMLLQPDIALLDHSMPGMTGIEIAGQVRLEKMPVKVVLLTMHKEKGLLDKAIATGVKGYLLKDFALEELEQCLQNVSKGEDYFSKQLTRHMVIDSGKPHNAELEKLTPAEQKILSIIASQKSTQDIADELFVSIKTVEKHRSNIIKKLALPHTPNSIALWAAKNLPK